MAVGIAGCVAVAVASVVAATPLVSAFESAVAASFRSVDVVVAGPARETTPLPIAHPSGWRNRGVIHGNI